MDNDLDQTARAKLRAARQRKHMTVEAVASRVGVTASTMSKYELGKRPVTLEVLSRWADAVEEPAEILLGKERTKHREPVYSAAESVMVRMLLRALPKMTRYEQDVMYEQLRLLSED